MKKILFTLVSAQLLFSCSNTKTEENQTDTKETTEVKTESPERSQNSSESETTATFDINSIPVSTQDVGDFPFFTLPKGLQNQNKPLQKNFDVCFFPIDGIMTPFEGRLYKANVVAEKGEEFSKRYFEKSLEDYLTGIGAVKVYDGEITSDEYKRYTKQDPNKGDQGDMGYTSEQIKFFVLRTQDKGNIYVQFSANNVSGKLNILQEEAMTQTITKVTSEEIANDLLAKGKSILHINFDTDKATLKADGSEVVQEIVKVLTKNPELRIAINGYTDNSGAKDHNQTLSENRALTVKNEIVKAGINADRLTSKGFGQDSPIASNDTEDGKAQNRRVELVKL
jgi:OOP family OmpA-OmpF porin